MVVVLPAVIVPEPVKVWVWESDDPVLEVYVAGVSPPVEEAIPDLPELFSWLR